MVFTTNLQIFYVRYQYY